MHFFGADANLTIAFANGIGINVDAFMDKILVHEYIS